MMDMQVANILRKQLRAITGISGLYISTLETKVYVAIDLWIH